MDHHHTAAGPMLVTSVVGAAGSILNTIIGALPEIVSVLAGVAAIAAGTFSALVSRKKLQQLKKLDSHG